MSVTVEANDGQLAMCQWPGVLKVRCISSQVYQWPGVSVARSYINVECQSL